MKTRREQMSRSALDGYHNFVGDDSEYKDWFYVEGRNRESDALVRSNFSIALRILGGEGPDVRVERHGHWAVGWIEMIYVRPGTDAERIGKEIEASLADYPVLDDEDFSQEEQEEAEKVWGDCLSVKERLGYIRENRSHFEFRDYADMIGSVRGKWFGGYAGELLA